MCLPVYKFCLNTIERGAKVLSDSNKIWIIWFLVLVVFLCHLILFFAGCGDQQLVKSISGLEQSTQAHSLLCVADWEIVMSLSPLLDAYHLPTPIYCVVHDLKS